MDVFTYILIPLLCILIIYSEVLQMTWTFGTGEKSSRRVPFCCFSVATFGQFQGLAFCLAFVGEDGGPNSRNSWKSLGCFCPSLCGCLCRQWSYSGSHGRPPPQFLQSHLSPCRSSFGMFGRKGQWDGLVELWFLWLMTINGTNNYCFGCCEDELCSKYMACPHQML